LEPLSDVFGPPRPEAGPHYLEILSDLPAEALRLAVERCLRGLKFYPMPIEILERADEYHRLHIAQTRLRTALWRIDLEQRRNNRPRNR
jgi:hypothetical protein